MPPKISVVMAVYNNERYLQKAVDSILNQTFADFEFIIIDDSSTDSTGALLAEYAARDGRIVLTRNERNLGLTRSLNLGLSRAQSPYVARMDGDDIILPDRFARQSAFLEQQPEIGAVGSWVQLMDEHGQVASPVFQQPTAPGFVSWCLYFYNPIAHPSVMMRREVVLRVGAYDPALARSQDHDLWCRLQGLTKLANVEAMLLYLRKHDSNISVLQCEEGLKNSIGTLKALMARTLRRDIPDEVIKCLYTGQYTTSHDAYQAAALVFALARASCVDPALTIQERHMIREDATRRLAELCRRLSPDPFSLRTWQALSWVYRLDPAAGRAELSRFLQRR